jgi:curved DNA-binding protein CbpA
LQAPTPSLYALLEVSADASPEQLRAAFRSLSKRFHPDTTSLPPEQASRSFQQLQQAMAVLADPEQRRRYDASLKQPAVKPSPALADRRPLSGGEWFALVLLGSALAFSLVLGIGLAWWRGMALLHDAPQL